MLSSRLNKGLQDDQVVIEQFNLLLVRQFKVLNDLYYVGTANFDF